MDGLAQTTSRDAAGASHRAPLLAFAADPATSAALQEGLSTALPGGFEIRRGNVTTALHALGQMPTPNALVIDITGADQPLASLADLRHVVEPHVKVMVVGDRQDVTFYREVTRTLGAVEYLYKPVSAEMVARHFGGQLLATSSGAAGIGGRLICVTGTRGGVGASTLAVNLAWYVATIGRRHVMLLDADLRTGTAAMLLGSTPSPGLRLALEAPDRIDEVFLERAAIPVVDRLHLLASEDAPEGRLAYRAEAVERLSGAMRRRFNYVVVDAPFRGDAFSHDLFEAAQQRVVVLLPTLASVRDAMRIIAMPFASGQTRRPVLVLNRSGMTGGLPRATIEETLGCKIDVVMPDLPKVMGAAESLGEPAAKTNGAFRAAIGALAGEMAFIVDGAQAGKGWRPRWWRR